MDKEYWDQFYSKNFSLDIPSQFCAAVCQEAKRGAKIIEFGCGNGRDSRVLAAYGFRVLGLDASQSAIDYCKDRAAEIRNTNLTYLRNDVTSLDAPAIEEFLGGEDFYLYSRFFQHSITEREQELMFQSLEKLAEKMIFAYFEFRNSDDENGEKIFGNHYRRYQSPKFFKEVLDRHGMSVDYEISGKGYAKYLEEDPNVTRITASNKKRST